MTDSPQSNESASPSRGAEMWSPSLIKERNVLQRQLRRAKAARLRPTGRAGIFGVGPAGLAAIVLALVFRRPELAAAFLTLAIAVEVRRQWKLGRAIRDLVRALQDPMDGS